MLALSVVSRVSRADQTQLFKDWISSFVSSEDNYATSFSFLSVQPLFNLSTVLVFPSLYAIAYLSCFVMFSFSEKTVKFCS